MKSLRTEARENLRLAVPLVAAQLTFIAFNVLDVTMAGRLGAGALAAIAVGGNFWVLLFIFFMGVFVACSPIVAQRGGAGQAPDAIGGFVHQCLRLALPVGLVWMALLRFGARPVLQLLELSAATTATAVGYLQAESWAVPAVCAACALRYSAEGSGKPRVVLAAAASGLGVKALGNYMLMFGGFGAPALGAVGAGWATLMAWLAMLGAYVVAYRAVPALAALQVWRARPLSREVLELFTLGLPVGAILFGEVAFFAVTALIMARFGEAAVAAHQVAINVASLAFMVPLGIALATTVRVGNAVGAGSGDARLRGHAGIGLGIAFSLVSASAMGFFPHRIAGWYTTDASIAARAAAFLRFAAVFQLFDCVQSVANGALRGIKDTRVPMLITLAAYWLIGLPVSWMLAFHTARGPDGLWLGFILALALAATGLAARFAYRTRRAVVMP